ncbi:MAG TPA: hypothetical protein VMM79_16135 [Longimicrobiales bacterium]|nr:hypothetical protein [Longimicrobiales bacterium]
MNPIQKCGPLPNQDDAVTHQSREFPLLPAANEDGRDQARQVHAGEQFRIHLIALVVR